MSLSRHLRTSRLQRKRPHLQFQALESRHCMAVSDLDISFGNAGVVYDQIVSSDELEEDVVAIAQNPAGGFYVAGFVNNGRGYVGTLWSYDNLGQTKPGFGSGGIAITPGLEPTDLALTSTGQIIVSGYREDFRDASSNHAVLQRVNANGTLDNTFGENGWVFAPHEDTEFFADVVVRPNGEILALASTPVGYRLFQYAANGQPDPNFQSFDVELPESLESSADVLLAEDGSVMIAAWYRQAQQADVIITRHLPTGAWDENFGSQGKQWVDLYSRYSPFDRQFQLQLKAMSNGQYILGGTADFVDSTNMFLFQFDSAGQPTPPHESDGKLISIENNVQLEMHDFTVMPDGRLFVLAQRTADFLEDSELVGLYVHVDGQIDTSAPQAGKIYSGYSSGLVGAATLIGDRVVAATDFLYRDSDLYGAQLLAFDLASGTLDDRFAGAGRVQIESAEGWSQASATSVVRLADGSYLQMVSGPYATSQSVQPVYLYKHDSLGAPVLSYGTSGRLLIDETVGVYAMLTKLMQTPAGLFAVRTEGPEIKVLKLDALGLPDASFGVSGHLNFNNADPGSINDILINDDGIYVALTMSKSLNNVFQTFQSIYKYDFNGQLDTGFGQAGIVDFLVSVQSNSMATLAQQPSGQLLAMLANVVGQPFGSITVHRLNANGQVDTSFGAQGVVRTGHQASSTIDRTHSLRVLADGSFITLGANDQDPGVRLERYSASGQLQTDFGTDGVATTNHVQSRQYPAELEIDSSGRIVVAATVGALPHDTIAVFRFTASGQPDTSFDGDGVRLYPLGSLGEKVLDFIVDPNGDIVLSGEQENDLALVGLLARIEGSEPANESWHNPTRPEDVNNDELITAFDALLIINRLNSSSSSKLEGANTTGEFYDVNNDGFLTALDALLVINQLNSQATAEGEAGLADDWLMRRKSALLAWPI